MNKLKYILFLILLIFVSCSNLQKYYSNLEKCMLKDDFSQAESLIEKSKSFYSNKSELLYYLDVGLTQHLTQQYQKSNANFELAKQIYSQNFTKSISAGAFSFFANDNVLTYSGHTYEMAYTNVFCALNYIQQGLDNEAVVEARQIDNLFKKVKADSHGKDFYIDDPFIRYFMGIVYENAGYYNDALVSYKIALRFYSSKNNKQKDKISYTIETPKDLLFSLYNLYNRLGMNQEATDLKNKFNLTIPTIQQNYGELVVINYNGIAPKKVDTFIEMSIYNALPYFESAKISSQEQAQAEQVRAAINAGLSNDYIKISFPSYERYNNSIASFIIEDVNEGNITQNTQNSYKVSDIGTIMISALQQDNNAIYAKTIARAVARFIIAKVLVNQIRQQESQYNNTFSILANSVLNITNSLLEQADKRSWRTLPEEINMSKIYLSEGKHTLNIKYLNSYGNIVYEEKFDANIIANKKTFIITKSFGN